MTRLLAEIEAHAASMAELSEIVSAMRSLAGMRMQEAQRTLPGIRRYADTIASALADTLLLMGEPEPARPALRAPCALVLCASEHGFVGGFNERLLESARTALTPEAALFVLGTRGGALALEQGLPVVWTHPMATRSAAAADTIEILSAELYTRVAAGTIREIHVLFARGRQGAASAPERRLLLPLDPASLARYRPRQRPLCNLDPVVLHEKLVAEYVFARLTEAAVESIASENAARFAAMEAAHDNVTRRLGALRDEGRRARQAEITAEILELATAATALGVGRE
jgi:F-type H+-transporting ATPase subunit gamma